MTDRIPPHDLEAEVAVLGSMLLVTNPSEAKSITDIVAPSDFYRQTHGAVFAAQIDLWETQAACDAVLLRNGLQEMGQLEIAGGTNFIARIVASVPSAANGVHYAQIVRNLAKKRAAIDAAADVLAIVNNGNDPEKLERAKERLAAAQSTDEPQWRDPVPISQFGAIEFPIEAFGYKHRDWIEDIAKGAQVAPDMPGTLLLSVLSASIARKFEVRVGGRWTEPLNLWTMVTAETGERKTPILTEAKAPLTHYEIERQIAERTDLIRQRATFKAAEARLAIATKALSKNPGNESFVKAHEDAIKALAETPEPQHTFRLLGDDVTPESLVAMMAHQNERLALFSSEGGMLKTVMGAQYSQSGAPNRDVLLKTFSGESITQDRKNSGSNALRRPSLTLGLFVQPTILDSLIRDKDNSDLGLLSRFLLCNCPSKIGYRDVTLSEPDRLTIETFRDNIKSLLELPTPDMPEVIPLADDALTLLNDFRREIEQRMREDQDLFHYRDFGAKLPGQVVRIAGNLAIAESVSRMDGVPAALPRDAIERGILLGRYYLAHATAAIGNASLDPDIEAAKRILAWIGRHPAPTVSVRDIFQGLKGPRSSIQRVDQLWRPINFLISSGWLSCDGGRVIPHDPPRSLRCHPNLQKQVILGDQGDHPLED